MREPEGVADRLGLRPLPAARARDLRPYLPGVEPERQVNDWGRSERIEGLLDRTLVDFFYRYWFRCEVEGIENVPSSGGALLVSNHSGALPPDATMIGKAIKAEHPRPRPLNVTIEHFFKGYPGFSMLLPKLGCVPAHPANVQRLLYDEQQLVLVFPEGRKGTEKLYKDRYKLRRFGRGGFVDAALRAQAPIVPVCVVGAEEAAPIFAQVSVLRRLTGLIYFPITPTFPHLGPLGMLGYLPAKFRIRFLEPIHLQGEDLQRDKSLVQTIAQEVRARIQDQPVRHGQAANVDLVRLTPRRVLITGLSTYWGARLAQALEQNPEVEAIVGVDNRDPTLELERTEFVRVGNQHSLLRRIVEGAEIDTVVDSRLVVDSVTTSARNAHENNVIGTMNILAACGGPDSSVRHFVFKSSAHYYGAEQDDPAFFTESMGRPHAPRTNIERDIVEAEATVADFAEKNPDVSVAILRFANVLGPDVRTSHTALFALPVVPMILGFDPRYQFAHEEDVVSALLHAVEGGLRGVFNVAADGVLALSEVIGLLGKRYAPVLPAVGDRPGGRRHAAPGTADPAGDAPADAVRTGPRQPQAEGDRLRLPLHDA